jgi:NAD(P)-dependent dehydrogenase (short-subunit alcohol dehydrogenase family)
MLQRRKALMSHQPNGSSAPAGKAVLVTGCSSGIGHATAIHLARRGFTVFATVRRDADVQSLRSLNEPNLVPICPLDLAKPEQIAPVIEAVSRELQSRACEGLYAIVNNAGGGSVAPIELMDLDKFRIEIEARILGPIALLQGFLPLIRQAHGRIVWIVTPAIIPIPFVSSIHICDFAVNCIARTLAIELKPWKIPNILIRCGGVKTAAPGKSAHELEEAFRRWPTERFQLYSDALQKEQQELSEFDTKRTDAGEIAKVVYAALRASKPRRRYQIGYMSGLAAALEVMPQTVVDIIMASRS